MQLFTDSNILNAYLPEMMAVSNNKWESRFNIEDSKLVKWSRGNEESSGLKVTLPNVGAN